MKHFHYFIAVLTLASVILSACGTSTAAPEGETVSPSNDSVNDSAVQNPEETEAGEEIVTNPEDEANSQTITYTLGGSEISESASLVSSPEQSFAIYTLPDFTLVSEEPGKDVLYLNEDSSIFMRIELIDESVNLEQLIQTTTDQLAVVSNVVSQDETSENVELPDAIKLEASNEEQIVTSYIKKGEFRWKITMFTTASMDYRDAFLQMAKTITPIE
ncbi:hypothetical protein SAMN05877753_10844 [Bacillus oleivorans]|uniref:Lipoprotein n=1 Tax=Bacillus oleivorans TaxID=1448271 RepID=A0A285D293_9BACI|nr:hypothetical protein [Bacillus oleivorans]SNX73931.1 hypothetical protein SAMN05877753_10844 [Bacillus oleivorans]